MKTILKDVKLGEKVTFMYDAESITAHVVGQNNAGSTLVAWKKNESRYRVAWDLEERRRTGEAVVKEVPQKYTHAYWVSSSNFARIINKPSPVATLGFLGTCIVAGAGLSRVTSNSIIKKTETLNQTLI